MTFPDEIARVSMIWQPTGSEWAGEQAVNTFHLRHHHITSYPYDWAAAVDYTAGKLHEKLVAAWGGISSFHSTRARVVGFKVAQLDSAGHTVSEGVYSDTLGDLVGTGGSNMLPPEVASCLTLWGFPPGGFTLHPGRKRGRMYLPYLTTALCDVGGTIKSDLRDGMTEGWGAFFNDVQGMHTDGSSDLGEHDYWELVVVSSVGSGLASQVDSLSMDSHFDSQRRRQHQSPPVRGEIVAISH